MADEERERPAFFVPLGLGGSGGLPNKRQYGDKSGLKRGVSCGSMDTGAEIEQWLEENCTGKWSLELESMNDTLTRRTFLAMFEVEADKLRFMEMVSGKGARKRSKAP